jgi:CHAT domain-containing protein/tetratricopeptide (TPR) repeat protein
MFLSFRAPLFLMALNLSLASPVLAQSMGSPSVLLIQQAAQSRASAPSEEAALRAVIENYFSAYGRKDLEGVIGLWSERAPDLATCRQSLQQQFTNEDLSFGSPALSRVKVEGEKANLRAAVALTSIDQKSRRKSEQQLVNNLELVKESGEWKVWRYAPAAEDLAAALAKADTEAEREGLLAEEKELVTVELGRALITQGQRLHRQGSYTEARRIYALAMEIAGQSGDKGLTADAHLGIGNAYRYQGMRAQGLEQLQQSLKISEEIGYKSGIANALQGLASAHVVQGNYTEALEQQRKSLKIREEIGDEDGIAMTLSSIGNVYGRQGNYAQALEQYRKCLRIFEEIGNKHGIASVLNSAGLTHCSQGNYAVALEQYQQSLGTFEEIGDRASMSMALNNIGVVHYSQGNYIQALEQYRKSLKIAEEIGNTHCMAMALNNIGAIHRLQGDYPRALQFAERAVDIAAKSGYREIISSARTNAGRAYFALDQFTQARLSFDQAISTIEDLRVLVAGGEREQQLFFESKISPYHDMVELLVAQNNPSEALSYAERAKARVLLDTLSSGRVSITKAMTSPEIEQEHRLRSQLVSLNSQVSRENRRQQPDQDRLNRLDAQLQRARLDFEAFQANLYAAHPELKPQRGEAAVIKAEEIAALLSDAGSALLEYAVTDDHTYLFAMTKAAGRTEAEARVYTLPVKRDELEKQIENFRRQLASRDLGFRESARRLYELLLKPAQAHLRGKTNLIIVPDDRLWELPFHALMNGADRFLIQDAALSYAPSLTVLREMTNHRRRRAPASPPFTLLALGNPSLDQETIDRATQATRDEKLDPLLEAEQEVKVLRYIYGASRSRVYTGPDAREDRAKSEAGEARILHFATHGILNDASPMYSHLVLARGDQNEDGLLEAWELMQLDLKADLVVLSACETARGRYGAGEGMIGLTWALFVAGVPSTLVSLWKVESADTRDLMLDFHRRLRTPPTAARSATRKAEALRQASLKLMKNPATSHPFYWAGFVLVGDDR